MDEGISGYRVGEKIGEGGMAIVFKARHLRLDRDVALKVMRDQLKIDTTFAERFLREAKISAKLSHPNIIQIYDVDEINSNLFLAMELVQGGDLNDRLKKERSKEDAIIIFSQLCEALDYAHGEGYVHRDIKPANILFRKNGALALSDFGIARAQHSQTQMTQAGSIIGTPSYMSPEQALGSEVDNRSDLYSLAVMMYEYVTGEKPYHADSTISTVIKHISDPLPILPKKLQSLQDFFDKALAKQPGERFATGSDLIEEFTSNLKKVKSISNQLDTEATIITNKNLDIQSPKAYLKVNVKPSKPQETTPILNLISLLKKASDATGLLLSQIKVAADQIKEKLKSNWNSSWKWNWNDNLKRASLASLFLVITLPLLIYGIISGQNDDSKIEKTEIATSTVKIGGFSEPKVEIDDFVVKIDAIENTIDVADEIGLPEIILSDETQEGSIDQQASTDIKNLDVKDETPDVGKTNLPLIDSCDGLYANAASKIEISDFKNAINQLKDAKNCSAQQGNIELAELIENKLLEVKKKEKIKTNWKKAGVLATNGDRTLEKGHLFLPESNNAWHYYSKALRVSPGHNGARNGLEKTKEESVKRIAKSIMKERFSEAEKDLNLLSSNVKNYKEIPDLKKCLAIAKDPRSETGKKISKLYSKGISAIRFKNVDKGKTYYDQISELAKYHPKTYKLGIKIAVFHLKEARKKEKDKRWESAEKLVSTGLQYHPKNKSLLQLHARIKPRLEK